MTQQRTPSGTLTSTSFRLCWRAPAHHQLAAGAAAKLGDRDAELAVQVAAGQGAGLAGDLGGRSLGDQLAPVLARSGAEVDDVVGGADRSLVVLDHDHRVAEVAQPPQRVDQLRVVALVEADRGLVEDVEDAHQRGADLGREPDPLRLAARERGGGALQRQVADPDAVQEPQALGDLAHHQARDRPLGVGQLQRLDPLQGGPGAEPRVLVDVEPAHRDREALRPQARPAARRAGLERHQALDPIAGVLRVGVLVAPLEAGEHAVEPHRVDAAAPEAVAIGDRVALVAGPLSGAARDRARRGPARGCRCRSRSSPPPPPAAGGDRPRPPSSTGPARPPRSRGSGRGRSARGR